MLHYLRNGHILFGCCALMAHKNRESYDAFFTGIRDSLPAALRAGPRKFSMDFEQATAISFHGIFPEAEEVYCFFHFSQSL